MFVSQKQSTYPVGGLDVRAILKLNTYRYRTKMYNKRVSKSYGWRDRNSHELTGTSAPLLVRLQITIVFGHWPLLTAETDYLIRYVLNYFQA